MNTTQKGDKLEDQVFSVFQDEILNGRFYVKKELCKIFKKKGYYSKDRERDIIFDVSIEIFLPGQSTYSHLVLIECKNYSHSVPVDDIEEFHAKFQQIGSNIKGIVATTNSFQESAFKFSESKGIGLLRHFDKDNLDWALTRSPSCLTQYKTNSWSRSAIIEGLYGQEYISRIFDWYCFSNGSYSNSLHDFWLTFLTSNLDDEILENLHQARSNSKNEAHIVPFIDEHEIEYYTLEILEKYKYKSGAVPLDSICSQLQRNNNLEYFPDSSLGSGVLGKITYEPFTIFIDREQTETKERFRFTLAHEFGHYFLGHQKFMSGEKCYKNDIDIENPRDVSIQDIQRMEWQANQFASYLLLPKPNFEKLFFLVVSERNLVDKGFGFIYLDDQQCNISEFYNVTMPLINEFQVSRSVVKIRLKKMGYLKEKELKINRNSCSTPDRF